MKHWILKYKFSLIGLLIGAILGYTYYHFIGCTTGSCAITSKPLNSTVYGMIMGYLMVSIFEKKEQKDA